MDETPLGVLKRVLGRWARAGEDPALARARLADDVTSEFDVMDLANVPATAFTVASRALIVGRHAKVVVVDAAEPSIPHLALLRSCNDGRWRLASLRFQCASCFGTGTLGLEPCDVCGATGWGLAASIWLE
jgi:hypothetical protein